MFAIGLITGVALTGAVAYALAPAIASRAAQSAVVNIGNDIGLPNALSVQIARQVGPIAAREVRAIL